MAASAPFCNVTVFAPPPGPQSPVGLRPIPPNATLADVIRITNENLSPTRQQQEFDRNLRNDILRPSSGVKPSQVRVAASKEVGRLRFTQMSIVRQKIKVENPKDKEQWVIDDRVKALTMHDQKTGANWVWQDANAGRGVQAGSEENG